MQNPFGDLQNERFILIFPQEMNRNRLRNKMRGETRQRPEQGTRPQGGLKMRPMRVKVLDDDDDGGDNDEQRGH